MTNDSPVQANPEAVKAASNMWKNFIVASKICGGILAIILILMAVFLV